MSSRTIVHVDMDCFFVAVERLDDPDLRGRPVAVGGTGRRGVVASASYEARAAGVTSAMPVAEALRRCPHLEVVVPRHGRYGEVSGHLMELLDTVSPLVEPVSVDEAFLDLSGTSRSRGSGRAAARSLRARVLAELGMECAVGVGPNKFLAKLASAAAKPGVVGGRLRPGPGVVVVEPDGVASFLHPLPIGRLWGVGPATESRLRRLGVATVGDLAELPVETLAATLGAAAGRHLHDLARGVDERSVSPPGSARSVGQEVTFESDRHSRDDLDPVLVAQSDQVGRRLRSLDRRARTVGIKVRTSAFSTITRHRTLDVPTDDGWVILATARDLLSAVDVSVGVRLVGVVASGLVQEVSEQLRIGFEEPGSGEGTGGSAVRQRGPLQRAALRRAELNRVVDAVRDRFGTDSVVPAASRVVRRPQVRDHSSDHD